MIVNRPLEAWTPEQRRYLAETRELAIAAPRNGRRGPWTPIWVVVVGDGAFVRTWQRRDTGWYGRAVASGRATIQVSGEPIDVIVTSTGRDRADDVDSAYLGKYGAVGARSMVTAEAVASTLRLARTGARAGR